MATRSFSITVIRPRDLLLLRVQFVDVDLDQSVAPAVVSGRGGAMMVVHFQPQHIAEQAYWDTGKIVPKPPIPDETPQPPGATASFLAGATRLAFRVPPGTSFPLTLEALLDALESLPLSVSAVAAYEPPFQIGAIGNVFGLNFGTTGVMGLAGRVLNVIANPPPTFGAAVTTILGLNLPPRLAAPSRFQTAIEAPYRLILSPDAQAGWEHASTPVDQGVDRVELWHTRLRSSRPNRDPNVRAIWAAGDDVQNAPQPATTTPPRMALDSRDRNQIVHFTSDHYMPAPFRPKPVETHRLMLTTLGAWLDLEQDWRPPAGWSLEQWRHVATMGRDHYVRVVEAGYLFPFGHRASLVKITERKFRFNEATQGFVAWNFQRMFIIVREPVKSYADRDMPFRTVEIRTRVTPDLAVPTDPAGQLLAPPMVEIFWPRMFVEGGAAVDVPFELAGTDWEGRTIEFRMPLVFVNQTVASRFPDVVAAYNKVPASPRRERALSGQAVAFAVSKASGDTTLEAATITFMAKDAPGLAPSFLPLMEQASVDIPAVQELLGKPVRSTIQFEETYLDGALATGNAIGNAANVYATVGGSLLTFPPDKTGGLVGPDINITALSRSLGPLGGNAAALVTPTGGQLDPADAFKTVELLGGILLSTVIPPLRFDNAASAEGQLPRFRSIRVGNVIETEYLWTLPSDKLNANDLLFTREANAEFRLRAVSRREAGSTAAPQFTTTGKLTNFAVRLIPSFEMARLHFNSVTFTVEPGKKLQTSVDLKSIEFLGILKFVNELRTVLEGSGFSKGPSIDVGTDGVRLAFSLGIPSIGVGVMTMQNISLSSGFFLPFTKDPMNFRFAFCERHQPFTLTVSALGGGGFIAMNIGLEGMKSLEAALEFGACLALNLGVASGSVSIMAGIYYQAKEGKEFELTAYIRACGEMDVLGIISVCIELYIALTYASKGPGSGKYSGKLWGQASVTVKIKIAFFSIPVSVSMERELAGSDPNFTDMVLLPDWIDYCDAFDDYVGVGGA